MKKCSQYHCSLCLFVQREKNSMMSRLFSFTSNIINYLLKFDRDSEDLLRKNSQVDMKVTKEKKKLQEGKHASCYWSC